MEGFFLITFDTYKIFVKQQEKNSDNAEKLDIDF